MAGYFGTEETQRLQCKSDDLMGWIMETPGACVTGRIIAADDWRKLGWDVVEQHLQQDGMFAFRWMAPEDVTAMREKLARTGAALFDWNGFMGDAGQLRAQYTDRLAVALPAELSEGLADGDDLRQMQPFLAKHGITPLSTDLMGGALCPACAYVIKNGAGRILATGFVGMLQNRFSPLADCAWLGLIAVDPVARGQGLGSRIMALLCKAGLERLGAARAIAFAAPDNTASIAMLTGAGLSPRREKSCVVVLQGGRPTR